jgi:glyoxylase-like metal-dependent hydrolase (beta-lactamase superfamily II)
MARVCTPLAPKRVLSQQTLEQSGQETLPMPSGIDVADRWFQVEPVADGISLIYEPHVDPFIRANIWHVRGRDRDLLIDTGLGVRSLRMEIPRLRERPVLCLATHCHFDHWGGHFEFDERLGHALEAEVYAAPTGRTTLADRYISPQSFNRLPYAGYEPMKYTVRPAPLTRRVDDGDIIDLGDRAFAVLHLPGHSPGQIGLWEKATGALFTGDALYDGTLVDDNYVRGPEEYLETMARLREMPVAIVHGGHCPSFGRRRMTELVDEYLAGKRAAGCPSETLNP